jgi:putative oxidoreductase
VALLTNRFVALGAVLLFPVSLNILMFHAFLNPRSVPWALVLFVPNALLLWLHRSALAPLLRP